MNEVKPIKKIRMVALDMDGTVLTTDKQLSDRNREAIEKALEMGIEIVPSTGRAHTNIPEQILAIEGIRYAVVCNGAIIYDIKNDTFVHHYPMEKERVIEFLNLVEDMEVIVDIQLGSQSIASKKSMLLWKEKDDVKEFLDYIYRSRVFVDCVAEYAATSEEPVYKVFIGTVKEADNEKIYRLLKDMKQWMWVGQGFNNIEITNQSIHKGTGLLYLGEMLGIAKDEIMACGDNGNDIDMLQTVGFSVAMENAEEHVKLKANYVTKTNDDDGVAYAIEKFVLENKPI